MEVSFPQLCSILLYGAAGFCIFLMLLNRVLILMRDSRTKTAIILLIFIAIMGSSAVLGLFLFRPPWVLAPVAALGLVLVGEARRAFIRRSCAGSEPLDSNPHYIRFFNPVTTTDLTIRRYEMEHPSWSGARLRIVHLTDLHAHPRLGTGYYQRVVDLAEQTQPDLAVFTGDFIGGIDSLPILRQVLRPIASVETFAVLGNHDYWTIPNDISAVVTGTGVWLLTNASVTVTVNGRDLVVSGYDYPWRGQEKNLLPQSNGRLHIVLSHNPDNIYRLAKSSADIVFSGHYHAGQIRLPFLGPIVVPSVYGRRFDHGHFVVNGTHLFVSSGIGASSPPFRLYCRPDIFVVDIVGGSHGESNEWGVSN
jgi:predicted MPP superfamily phosphohydrolase